MYIVRIGGFFLSVGIPVHQQFTVEASNQGSNLVAYPQFMRAHRQMGGPWGANCETGHVGWFLF